VATLRWWRHVGIGPHSFKIGRDVRYRISDVRAWIDRQHGQQSACPATPRDGARHEWPRPERRWRCRHGDSADRDRARHFERQVDAQSWLDSVTTAVGTGSYVDPSRAKVTVGTMAEQWFAGKINLRATTPARYQSALRVHVMPRWGVRDVGCWWSRRC
jgi:hypothetical protein